MPVKYWGIENIEENTQLQAERLGRSPVVKGHVALMPDGHVGAGATIGSVFVSDTGMIPAAIGVDIGLRNDCCSDQPQRGPPARQPNRITRRVC